MVDATAYEQKEAEHKAVNLVEHKRVAAAVLS
jgi:hypothetical protein